MTLQNRNLEALRRAHLQKETGAAGSNRRHRGRFHLQQLRCSLGTVTDLSASGLRLLSRRLHHDDVGRTVIVDFQGGPPLLVIPAIVVWIQRVGLLRHAVGLRFVGLTEEQQRQVMQLARAHGPWSDMGDDAL
jgi:PilZ domain